MLRPLVVYLGWGTLAEPVCDRSEERTEHYPSQHRMAQFRNLYPNSADIRFGQNVVRVGRAQCCCLGDGSGFLGFSVCTQCHRYDVIRETNSPTGKPTDRTKTGMQSFAKLVNCQPAGGVAFRTQNHRIESKHRC